MPSNFFQDIVGRASSMSLGGVSGANVINGAKRAALRGGELAMGAMSRDRHVAQAARSSLMGGARQLGRAAGYGALAGAGVGMTYHTANNMMHGRRTTMGGLAGAAVKGGAAGAVLGAGGYGAYKLGRTNSTAWRGYDQVRGLGEAFSKPGWHAPRMPEEPI